MTTAEIVVKEATEKLRQAVEAVMPGSSRSKSLGITKIDEAELWLLKAARGEKTL